LRCWQSVLTSIQSSILSNCAHPHCDPRGSQRAALAATSPDPRFSRDIVVRGIARLRGVTTRLASMVHSAPDGKVVLRWDNVKVEGPRLGRTRGRPRPLTPYDSRRTPWRSRLATSCPTGP